ncbi:hypothetical protein [Hephaestia caeni]|uniref:hypothetical protein n=1 Tax=Hephaestia caeni TaxID=645617 RepID=UPI001FEC1560|nr:hypothetical protein [Hephaestia caeni]
MAEANHGARARSARADVRNPALLLPAARAMRTLAPDIRLLIAVLLFDLQRDARGRADKCWAKRKAFMAAYWSVVAVYSGHFARAFTDDLGARRSAMPFLVRQEGFPEIRVHDWNEASKQFCRRRDRLDLGASHYPDAIILIGSISIGRISYNGRIWPVESWEPGQEPIFDNRTT